jgi:DNA-binding MarR family transcriptional regulator
MDIQTQLLHALAQHGEMTIGDLCIALDRSPQSITSALFGARQRGHVAIIPIEELQVAYSITAAGQRALTACECLAESLAEKRRPGRLSSLLQRAAA